MFVMESPSVVITVVTDSPQKVCTGTNFKVDGNLTGGLFQDPLRILALVTVVI
jgi:hypothetical protein